MSKKDYITVIQRFERGGLTAYSVDGGKTYHETTGKALQHLQQKLKEKKK